jgi:large subunit ribosomal protein L22
MAGLASAVHGDQVGVAERQNGLDGADEALDILRYQPQRGARMLEKVLKSALGNAEDRRAPNVNQLVVVDARVDEGPMFKRIRPQSRGMAFVIKRRMAHIRVALDTK